MRQRSLHADMVTPRSRVLAVHVGFCFVFPFHKSIVKEVRSDLEYFERLSKEPSNYDKIFFFEQVPCTHYLCQDQEQFRNKLEARTEGVRS